MTSILGLGTYPVIHPVHGGQRRVTAFREFYASIGVRYGYACVYNSRHYGRAAVAAHDVPWNPTVFWAPAGHGSPLPFVEDLSSGLQAAEVPETFDRLCSLIEQMNPQALQLEQPFMWPFVRKLKSQTRFSGIPVIYSSHNFEGPLKEALLRDAGTSPQISRDVRSEIESLEREICSDAAIVISVSRSESELYSPWCGGRPVTVVANGVARPPARGNFNQAHDVFGGNRFLFFVGSSYPPNVQGFCDLVARDGLYFCPPQKTVAICGGVCDGIFATDSYQKFLAANSVRVHFFPHLDDTTLWSIKEACHAVLLPITTGGGSNLKTAEALALGKWVISTSTALRAFEDFAEDPNILIADDSAAFHRAAGRVLRSDPPTLSPESKSRRDELFWDRCFARSQLGARLLDNLSQQTGADLRLTA